MWLLARSGSGCPRTRNQVARIVGAVRVTAYPAGCYPTTVATAADKRLPPAPHKPGQTAPCVYKWTWPTTSSPVHRHAKDPSTPRGEPLENVRSMRLPSGSQIARPPAASGTSGTDSSSSCHYRDPSSARTTRSNHPQFPINESLYRQVGPPSERLRRPCSTSSLHLRVIPSCGRAPSTQGQRCAPPRSPGLLAGARTSLISGQNSSAAGRSLALPSGRLYGRSSFIAPEGAGEGGGQDPTTVP